MWSLSKTTLTVNCAKFWSPTIQLEGYERQKAIILIILYSPQIDCLCLLYIDYCEERPNLQNDNTLLLSSCSSFLSDILVPFWLNSLKHKRNTKKAFAELGGGRCSNSTTHATQTVWLITIYWTKKTKKKHIQTIQELQFQEPAWHSEHLETKWVTRHGGGHFLQKQ